jgi:hypothetical protein
MCKSACPIVLALGVIAVTLAGCHTPSGGIMPFTGGSTTYYSTEMMQKTVTLVDLRSGEVLFAIDVPVGKQLTIDFDKEEGDDPVNRPDLMRWEIMEQGTSIGKLDNQMSVPNAASRRVDVTLRHGPAYAGAQPPRPLRSDETANRPAWWTPEGGPMPEDKAAKLYDD